MCRCAGLTWRRPAGSYKETLGPRRSPPRRETTNLGGRAVREDALGAHVVEGALGAEALVRALARELVAPAVGHVAVEEPGRAALARRAVDAVGQARRLLRVDEGVEGLAVLGVADVVVGEAVEADVLRGLEARLVERRLVPLPGRDGRRALDADDDVFAAVLAFWRSDRDLLRLIPSD